MNIKQSTIAFLVLFSAATNAFAQHAHSDIEFGYLDGRIDIEFSDEGPVFESEFPLTGISRYFSTLPGFASEVDEGLGVNAGDEIFYNVLGDLQYWDGGDFAAVADSTEIRIRNNPSDVADTIVSQASGELLAGISTPTNRIGDADEEGEIHSDLQWFIESTDEELPPAIGAYGIELSLSTTASDIEDSPSFYLVFNLGLEEEAFEEGVESFANLLANLLGDFDESGMLDVADIDLLNQAVATSSSDSAFDLTDDGLSTAEDRAYWLEVLAGTTVGDADLNGAVEFADFLALSNAFGMEGGWANGDFDGNGMIEFADFLALSDNFGEASVAANATSVPEPAAAYNVAWLAIAVVLIRQRRGRFLNLLNR